MGTEGRNSGIREIQSSSTIYEMIVFRASDIIDLRIDTSNTITDPAVVTSSISANSENSDKPSSNPIPPISSIATINSTMKSNNSTSNRANVLLQSDTQTFPTKPIEPIGTNSSKQVNLNLKENKLKELSKPNSTATITTTTTTPIPKSSKTNNQNIGIKNVKEFDKDLSPNGSLTSLIIDPAPFQIQTELKPARTYEPVGATPSKPIFQLKPIPNEITTRRLHRENPRSKGAGFPREFDLDRANRRFETILASEEPMSSNSFPQQVCYNSNVSFFDTLPNRDTENSKGKEAKRDFHLNVETFGPIAYNSKLSYYNSKKNSNHPRRGAGRYNYEPIKIPAPTSPKNKTPAKPSVSSTSSV